MTTKLQQAHQILDAAIQQHKPSLIVLSFSGGYDSMVSSHVAARWSKRHAHSANVITVSVDTLLSADGWCEFVTDTARQLRLPRFQIAVSGRMAEWAQRVIDNGFPFTRSQHKINFYYLKQVAFRAIIADHKKHRTDRIMFVNGVRRAESVQRSDAPAIARYGGGVFVNPILRWSEEDLQHYRLTHDMPVNPFYDTVGNSGDCQCNWHTGLSIDDLHRHGTRALQAIEPLHYACLDKFGYGYGMTPRNGAFHDDAGLQMSLPGFDETPNLCVDCQRSHVGNTTLDDVLMNRIEW